MSKTIREWQSEVYRISKEHGFHENESRPHKHGKVF